MFEVENVFNESCNQIYILPPILPVNFENAENLLWAFE